MNKQFTDNIKHISNDFKYDWIEHCSTQNRFIVKLDNKYALFNEKAEQIA